MIKIFVCLSLILFSCSNGKEVANNEQGNSKNNEQETAKTNEQKKIGNELKIKPEEIKKMKNQTIGEEQSPAIKGKNKKQNSKL